MIGQWSGRGVVAGSAAAVIALATPFIAVWEGKRNATYYDIVGVATVCYGHTGKYAVAGARYTDAQCADILREDVAAHWAVIDRCVDDDVPVSVQAAILELGFNVGAGSACNSTMVRKANEGDYAGACDQLDRWVMAGGNRIQGLVNRRNASQEVCMRDVP